MLYKKSDVESPNSEVKSQKSEAGFQNTKVQSHTSEVFYKKSDVEYQNSEVKYQKPETGFQNTEV